MNLEAMTWEEITNTDPLEMAARITIEGPQQQLAETLVVEHLDFDINFWAPETQSFWDVEIDRERCDAWALLVWDMLPELKQIAIEDKLERAKAEARGK